MSRRGFLKTAAAMVAAPYVIPASALGADGNVSPSERIVMAGIGIGGRGSGDLGNLIHFNDCQFVAVADTRKDNRERVKNMIDGKNGNKDSAAYIDYHEVLARQDIDAVLIATSDRWHTPMSVFAMRAGKDVYCEKPCSFSLAEGRVLADTARHYGRVYQAGTQRRSEEPFVFIRELARRGYLGKVHTFTADIWGGNVRPGWLPPEPEPPREVLDWDVFLGPAPWRPYNRGYLGHGGKEDFHTGCIGEWGSHTVDQAQWINGSVLTGPVEFEFPNNDDGGGLVARYADGVKLVLKQGGFPNSCGIKVEGSEGWAFSADSCGASCSQKSLNDKRKQLVQRYIAETQRPLHHWRDFLDCCKNRRLTVAQAEHAHRSVSSCHCANICMKLRRNLKWDPVKEEFIGDDEANRLRRRPSRPQYSV
ncbi:MAG: Gfo/Idh/MocA family oxidoreductase [Planctomycetota bacterium]|nr:Gfo/Idh/MocA family oxidoreductase [Planctomycetota bacterium]